MRTGDAVCYVRREPAAPDRRRRPISFEPGGAGPQAARAPGRRRRAPGRRQAAQAAAQAVQAGRAGGGKRPRRWPRRARRGPPAGASLLWACRRSPRGPSGAPAARSSPDFDEDHARRRCGCRRRRRRRTCWCCAGGRTRGRPDAPDITARLGLDRAGPPRDRSGRLRAPGRRPGAGARARAQRRRGAAGIDLALRTTRVGTRRWLARHGARRRRRHDRHASGTASSPRRRPTRRGSPAARGDELAALGHVAFRIGLSSLGLGAEPVGRLALAIERAADRLDALDEGGLAALDAALATLAAAFHQLANPDKSGARVEDLPLAERTASLDAAIAGTALSPAAAAAVPSPPLPAPPPAIGGGRAGGRAHPGGERGDGRRGFTDGRRGVADGRRGTVGADGRRGTARRRRRSSRGRRSAEAAPPPAAAFVWTPAVDDDMVELFFDEAAERLEALAGKLVEVERRPADADLLRDVFRDLHTVKGSSAMVGLAPVNHLAHAAEDLVGQIRDGGPHGRRAGHRRAARRPRRAARDARPGAGAGADRAGPDAGDRPAAQPGRGGPRRGAPRRPTAQPAPRAGAAPAAGPGRRGRQGPADDPRRLRQARPPAQPGRRAGAGPRRAARRGRRARPRSPPSWRPTAACPARVAGVRRRRGRGGDARLAALGDELSRMERVLADLGPISATARTGSTRSPASCASR